MANDHSFLDSSVNDLLSQFQTYSNARSQFLEQLNLSRSCRDPLAEFSEILVSRLLDARLADSRVQKGYDLIRPDQRLVQVKYLINSTELWINEHTIIFPPLVDEYALVVFISLKLNTVFVFKRETLSQVCLLLKKSHPKQDTTLQFTRRNYYEILSNLARFEELGMEIYRFDHG